MGPSAPCYTHDCASSFCGPGAFLKIFFEEVPDTKKEDREEMGEGEEDEEEEEEG